jgi:DNA-binding NarL/FixJ family response regulator
VLRILIADCDEVVRKGVRDLVATHPGWEVCGEASHGCEALAVAAREKPDVAILAVTLPQLSGVSLTRWLSRESPSTKVLLFTKHEDDSTIRSALAAGARGYLLKTESEQCLEIAIAERAADRPYFSACVTDFLLRAVTDYRRWPRARA